MANDMLSLVVATMTDQVNSANDLATKVSETTKGTGALIHEIRDEQETTDETVLAFRAWFEKANAAIEARVAATNEYITANLLPTADASFDAEAAKTQYSELKKAVNAAKAYLGTLPGVDIEAALKDVPALKSLRGGTVSGGGDGGKRPRLANIWIDGQRVHEVVEGKNGKPDRDVSSFTLAARFIGNKEHANCKVEVKDLQAAAFAAAKTDDLKSLNGSVVEFSYSPDNGAHSYSVKFEPSTDSDAAAEVTTAPATTEAVAETEVTPETAPAE